MSEDRCNGCFGAADNNCERCRTMKKEQVNHPAHYNIPGRKECIEEMIDKWGFELTAIWCEMTAYKYEYRAGLKDGNSKEQDMAKRDWYLRKAKEIRAVPRMTVPMAVSNAVTGQMPATVEITAENTNDAAEKDWTRHILARFGV